MYTQHTMLQQQAVLPDYLANQSSHADAQGHMVEDLTSSQQRFAALAKASGDNGHFDDAGENWISTIPGQSITADSAVAPPEVAARMLAARATATAASSSLPAPVIGIGALVAAGLAYLVWRKFH